MSMKAYNSSGIISVLDEDDNFVFDIVMPKAPVTGTESGTTGHPMSPDTTTNQPIRKRKIILGPLPRPPIPRAQLSVTNHLRRARYGWPVINLSLEAAFENGDFSQESMQEIRKVVSDSAMGNEVPLQIHAVLPQNHEIDLTLLSRHASKLGELLNRQVQMRVGTNFLDE
jgi:hypothetical protein